MFLSYKTSKNIWPFFLKSLPLHHLTPEWWNGRHEGLKIPWPLRLYEFESRFRHLPSVGFPAGGIFCGYAVKALRLLALFVVQLVLSTSKNSRLLPSPLYI